MEEELARMATEAARDALRGWTPGDPQAVDRLAHAIGEAVAAAVARHEELEARHTELVMETSCADLSTVTGELPRRS